MCGEALWADEGEGEWYVGGGRWKKSSFVASISPWFSEMWVCSNSGGYVAEDVDAGELYSSPIPVRSSCEQEIAKRGVRIGCTSGSEFAVEALVGTSRAWMYVMRSCVAAMETDALGSM